MPAGKQVQSVLRQGWPGEIATQPLATLTVMRADARLCVHTEAVARHLHLGRGLDVTLAVRRLTKESHESLACSWAEE